MLLRVLSTLLIYATCTLASAATPVAVPEPLRGWEAWVLHGEDFRGCPFYATVSPDGAGAYACALPGVTSIQIAAGRAEIAVDMRVYAPGYAPLVFAERSTPEALSVDGKPGVIEAGGAYARVWLEPGSHQLRYALDLAAQPESLSVPQALRLVELRVDGRAIFPLNREGEQLWLQRAQTTTESDALEVSVHRLWRDSIPQVLETRIELHVAGKAREIRLGPAWPEGYELSSIDGDLPATVEPACCACRPPPLQLHVSSRSLERSDQLSFEFPTSDSPGQEIWSFAADHRLRVVDASGSARSIRRRQGPANGPSFRPSRWFPVTR